MTDRTLRCAIYTRKSSEEGLEQNFNSLHAQREACEAYVLSQAGEGWTLIPQAYDDGGFSGGNMQRPGLQALLADIDAGRIDIVVVYKVDRLTRALTDFARIVERFDEKYVSFVSVTQAFNTTTSMGRLTLNVLLSFAQFEREVTGERIRDKVAASKAKGLRMGGRPPLGYDIVEGRLVINAAEADRVRDIFQRFLAAHSLTTLAAEGFAAKRWVNKAGRETGGGRMTAGALRHILRNAAYTGATCHKTKVYPKTHPAIIGPDLWAAVQARLGENAQAASGRSEAALLAGRLFDDRGHPMVAVHTNRRGRRYRYYLSKAKLNGLGEPGSCPRISSGLLEGFLLRELGERFSAGWRPDAAEADRALDAIDRITLGEDRIEVRVIGDALRSDVLPGAGADDDPRVVTLRIAFEMRRRQGAIILQAPGAAASTAPKLDRALVRAVVMARSWAADLETGAVPSILALARREGLCNHYTTRLLRLAYLAPDLVEQVLAGRQPAAVSLGAVTASPLPLSWTDQRAFWSGIGRETRATRKTQIPC